MPKALKRFCVMSTDRTRSRRRSCRKIYMPAYGTNNLLGIIQLMRKGDNFEFKLDGAIASLGSSFVTGEDG